MKIFILEQTVDSNNMFYNFLNLTIYNTYGYLWWTALMIF